MAVAIKQREAAPAAYPLVPVELSAAAAALDAAAIWQRIEAYIAVRWTEREVEWIVEGDGDWCPNLGPLEITAEEVWNGSAWEEATTVYASPYGGYRLTTCGPYRFTGIVGGGEVPLPAAVFEAFRRLAEYCAAVEDHPGTSSYSLNIGGAIQETIARAPTWRARAMQLSGAADLLRPYRRV